MLQLFLLSKGIIFFLIAAPANIPVHIQLIVFKGLKSLMAAKSLKELYLTKKGGHLFLPIGF